jgi:peptidoglycan/LPS O-acetylase OafA/YrhL
MRYRKSNIRKSEGSKFYFGVHLLRGLAAFLVVCYHYKQFAMTTPLDFSSLESFKPPNPIISLSNNYGSFGVEIFWSISGFILAKKYFFTPIKVSKFMVIRYFRLYPIHLLTLVIVSTIQLYTLTRFGHFNVYGNNGLSEFLLQLFMASNWVDHSKYSFNAPIWSVSIEILVYLLFIILVRIRASIIMAGVVLMSASAIRVFCPESWLLAAISFFFLGVVLSFQLTYGFTNNRIFLLIVTFAILIDLNSNVRIHLIWVLLLLSVVNSLEVHILKIKLLKRLSLFLGNISYSLYLLHIPVQLLLLAIIETCELERQVIAESNLFFCFYIFCCICFSSFLYRKFEKPSRELLMKKFFMQ